MQTRSNNRLASSEASTQRSVDNSTLALDSGSTEEKCAKQDQQNNTDVNLALKQLAQLLGHQAARELMRSAKAASEEPGDAG